MRKFLLLLALALIPFCLEASWAPSLSVTGLYHMTDIDSAYDSSGALRRSLQGEASVNLLSLTLSRHRLSLPLAFGYISESQIEGRTLAAERYEAIVSLEYGCRLISWFSLSISADVRLSVFPETEATLWRFGTTVRPALHPVRHLSITLPLALIAGEAEIAMSCGLGAQVAFGGWS